LVRLADDARKCVVYLGFRQGDDDSEIEPIGTGFIVAAGDPVRPYIVTARHVAEEFKTDPFVIRLNDKDGKGRNDHVDSAEWFFHPSDENIDVAVREYDPPDWADYLAFPRSSFLSEFKLDSKDIGAGDLAYVVGVFSLLHGKRRNMPAVHTGHISLMALDEPIPVRDWRDETKTVESNGYLVEAQTLPGTSGGPVFVRRSVPMPTSVHGKLQTWSYGTVWLLGLWQGSWYGAPERYLKLPRDEDIQVPLGTGIVVPAIDIISALEQDDLMKRNKGKKNEDAPCKAAAPAILTVETSASDYRPKGANPRHREDFTALVSVAARKRPPGAV
jgi:Trypsin-like peptidase domain